MSSAERQSSATLCYPHVYNHAASTAREKLIAVLTGLIVSSRQLAQRVLSAAQKTSVSHPSLLIPPVFHTLCLLPKTTNASSLFFTIHDFAPHIIKKIEATQIEFQ